MWPVQRRLYIVVEGIWFTMLMAATVLLHAIFLAIDTDNDLGTGIGSTSFVFNSAFNVLYVVEVSLRLAAHRMRYFRNGWNVLDFGLVTCSAADLCVNATDLMKQSMSIVVVFRILSLMKLLRVVRLFRFFKPLWLLACGIAMSVRTACWAWLLIGMLVYVYGLCLTRIFSPHLRVVRCNLSGEDVTALIPAGITLSDLAELKEYFGNIFSSMFSVFQVTTVEDWNAIAAAAAKHEPWARILFVLILGSTAWGVIHVIVAVFVENAVEESNLRATDVARKATREYEEVCRKLCEVFFRADSNGDGQLSYHEFVDVLERPGVREELRAVGIDGAHAADLFDILDMDGSSMLDGTEFVEGVIRSRGAAQNKDVIGARCDVWRVQMCIQTELERADQFIQARVQQTVDRVNRLREAAVPVLQQASDTLKRNMDKTKQNAAEAKDSLQPITEAPEISPFSAAIGSLLAEKGFVDLTDDVPSGARPHPPACKAHPSAPSSHPPPAAARGRAASQGGSWGRGGAAPASFTAMAERAPSQPPQLIPVPSLSTLQLMPTQAPSCSPSSGSLATLESVLQAPTDGAAFSDAQPLDLDAMEQEVMQPGDSPARMNLEPPHHF
eukprot:gnl/TRDRNA2_/TRDRNA2_66563_c0_seq1.p1 gnl/TRDRNA2_/TRDRNA2_66563_c0~~gnl/TRDRNA2_/TRDRNA2_66563_c0_seq1.p1  ORF type:complete len:659 (+),score=91.43 gnl/TRDRNA2_/TRDRNA2_66563_c0_seq1:143-1978(+)